MTASGSGVGSNFRAITEVTCFLFSAHRKYSRARDCLPSPRLVNSLLSGVREMRSKLMLCVVLGLASAAYAKEPKPYQTGKILQMDSVQCGMAEKDAKSLAGEMLGTDSGNKKTQEVLCQEYVLQGQRVIYRIRPDLQCGMAEKDAKSLAGEMLGTDSGNKKTQEVLCQEYVLQGQRVIYRIR